MNELEIRGLKEIIKEEVEEQLSERIDELRDTDSEEEEEDSGEDSLPPEQEEPEEEVVDAPRIVTPGQQVSKAEMKALNKPTQKLVPETKKEEEKWEDEFREWINQLKIPNKF